MKRSKLLSLKSLITLMAIIGIFWFSPESLYSQMATQPSKPKQVTTQSAPSQPVEPKTDLKVGQKTEAKSAAEQELREPFETFKRPSLITQAVALTLLSLSPFIIMILTSFLKIVVVLSLLRSALGVQQAPPNQIINGVAFLLSLFVMYPTVTKMYDASQDAIHRLKAPESFTSPEASNYIIEIAGEAKKPLQDFLKINSNVKHQALFYRIAYKGLPEEYRQTLKPDDFMILMPAYITSQLKEAFEIGVLIYIPFFVIDLVTSNILLAMGMMMLSPVTISMPLKLFLLVMLDGWTLLIEGLVNTFR